MKTNTRLTTIQNQKHGEKCKIMKKPCRKWKKIKEIHLKIKALKKK